MNPTLPPQLLEIEASVQRSRQIQPNLEHLQSMFQAHLARLPEIPSLLVEYGGEIVRLGEFSPGCQACQDGAFDCVFLSHESNLRSAFCCSPQAIPKSGSVFGDTPETIIENYRRTRINGVGFTGGEPFSQPEKLFDWLARFKSALPELYTWVCTDGLLVKEEHLQRLGELGLDELCCNAAASGYDHPTVLHTLELASRYIPHLTVEIPSIPEDEDKLLGSLETWSALGVRYLNLHELIYQPGTHADSLPGARQVLVTEDGQRTEFNPDSRRLTARVIEQVWQRRLPLNVNDCSLQCKLRQLRGRRKSLAPLTRRPHERLVKEEFFESYCVYDQDELIFFHSDLLDEMHRRYPDRHFARLMRRAPLALEGRDDWVVFEKM